MKNRRTRTDLVFRHFMDGCMNLQVTCTMGENKVQLVEFWPNGKITAVHNVELEAFYNELLTPRKARPGADELPWPDWPAPTPAAEPPRRSARGRKAGRSPG